MEIELIKQIKEQGIDIKILALTMHGEAKIIKQVMQLGIDGYIIKNSGRDKVLEALGQIFSGQPYFSYEVTKAIMDDLSNKPQKKDRLTMEVSLSKRETEVLDLIVQEMNNHQIAEKLFISVRTVESHKQSLLFKTGSKNVAGLVLYAMNHI
ncbi:MAG: response regulator transcription factor [Marinoscillum sp.]